MDYRIYWNMRRLLNFCSSSAAFFFYRIGREEKFFPQWYISYLNKTLTVEAVFSCFTSGILTLHQSQSPHIDLSLRVRAVLDFLCIGF